VVEILTAFFFKDTAQLLLREDGENKDLRIVVNTSYMYTVPSPQNRIQIISILLLFLEVVMVLNRIPSC
jgi:hypothetical protein